jgi:catechol 2,3-dioxygenase-like lactoylglutathione lyase family enzyme
MDATLQHLRAHGVPFVKELVERAAYSYCYVADPDGYAIEFLHFKPAVK